MFNAQVIIAAVAGVAAILVVYFILRRGSTPQTPSDESEKKERGEVTLQEKGEVVPEIKESAKREPLPGISPERKEEKAPEVVTSPSEEKPLMGRRKSDKIIQKRPVPDRGKITKQNFSEFAGERVLVAEDNLINQKVILGLLAESGIEVVMANDGQEALDILEHDTNFVMILMDAHMPRVDGFEATRIIRANPRYDDILVVALSGDTATDDIQKMKDAGMAEQLAKPLRMEALYNILYAYTGKETDKDEFEEAVMVKHLDINRGLETCGGDGDFYREILSEFISDYAASSVKLGELLRSHNLEAADGYLLDIIGVTENIGAHTLAEIASNMKLALSDTEQSYFSLFDQYKLHLDRLMQDIREYL